MKDSKFYATGKKIAEAGGYASYQEFIKEFGFTPVGGSTEWCDFLHGGWDVKRKEKEEKLGPKLRDFLVDFDLLMAKYPEISVGECTIEIDKLNHDFYPSSDRSKLFE